MIKEQSFSFSSILNPFLKGKEGRIFGLILLGLLWIPEALAQIQVIVQQPVEFGSFIVGEGGGTVTISHDGVRTATGDIHFLNASETYHPAIFEVEAPTGDRVYIQNGSDVQLTRSNGETMTLSVGESSHGSSFISNEEGLSLGELSGTPYKTLVSVGATITAGKTTVTPPGEYSGSFFVTFILE